MTFGQLMNMAGETTLLKYHTQNVLEKVSSFFQLCLTFKGPPF